MPHPSGKPHSAPRRVAIIGAGIMGLCTGWALAARGHAVTIFEQYEAPNPLGSSVDQHRLIRHPYGDQAGYTRMVDEAYAAWDRLWTDLGQSFYVPTGTLVLSSTGRDLWLQSSLSTLAELGHEAEQLDGGALERRFPMLDTREVTAAFHMPTGGVLLAEPIIRALVAHLQSRGVRLETGARVTSVDPQHASVTLAHGGAFAADDVVICAGPWVTRLLPNLKSRVTPSRQVLVLMNAPPHLHDAWTRAPMVLDIDPDCGFYVVPPVAGTSLKTGDHRFSLTGDPDHDRDATREEAEAIFALAHRRLKDFDQYALTAAKTCFYIVQPEERFIVEPVGGAGWVMTGFSGHGFKFASILGERMADLVEGSLDAATASIWAAGLANG